MLRGKASYLMFNWYKMYWWSHKFFCFWCVFEWIYSQGFIINGVGFSHHHVYFIWLLVSSVAARCKKHFNAFKSCCYRNKYSWFIYYLWFHFESSFSPNLAWRVCLVGMSQTPCTHELFCPTNDESSHVWCYLSLNYANN